MTISEHHVLIIDDDADALMSLVRTLKISGLEAKIHAAGNGDKALELQRELRPQVAIVDLCLDERRGVQSGFDLIEKLLRSDPSCRVIVLTGHSSVEHGVKSIQRGAASFLEKPADIAHLSALVTDAITQSTLRRAYEARNNSERIQLLHRIAGSSAEAVRVREELRYAAFSIQPILITGETGTGKGLCAKIIHDLSIRHQKKFIRYQPTYASADLVNSDLFGHLKGSFTGAIGERRGLMQEAHGGSLFLDEIDELPTATQVSLLGVLQERTFRPLGSNQEIAADFRLITASNTDIEQALHDGKIRRDFYHRIAHTTLHLAPLRERLGDIPEIIELFLNDLRGRTELSVFGIADEVVSVLQRYTWPGNIRELEAVIETAAFRAQYDDRQEIALRDVKLQRDAGNTRVSQSFHDQVSAFKLTLIEGALARHGGNQVRAAKDLGLDRSTMRRLLSQNE